MSDYSIRLYKDSDYKIVREIFACGIKEHTSVAFCHALSLPRIWLLLLVVSLLPFLTTGSFIISIMAAIIVLVVFWFINSHMFTSYVQSSLADDILDIRKYYLQREGYCFWVAEWAGEIVGMVATAPLHRPGGEKQMELRRLSVPKRHRGKGIGKALCRTVIDFAQKRGCNALILDTSMCQTSSWRMYEKMGFRRTHTFYPDYYFAEFLDFIDMYYQYDIPTQD